MSVPAKPSAQSLLLLSQLSVDELRSHLTRAIELTAESLYYLASVWSELERRGTDLSDLKISLAPYLRDVADGRLAPEAVLTFAGQRRVLQWVSKRSLAEQKSLARGTPITVLGAAGEPQQINSKSLSVTGLRQIVDPRYKNSAQPDSPKNTTVAISVSQDEYNQIKRSALDAGLTISNFLRQKTGLKKTNLRRGPRAST